MWEGILSLNRQNQGLPVSIDDRVWYWGNNHLTSLQKNNGNISDTLQELWSKFCDFKHFQVVNAAIIKHLLDDQSKEDREDVHCI